MKTALCAFLITFGLCSAALADTAVKLNASGGERPLAKCRNMMTSAGSIKLLNAVAATASAATRTITLPIESGWTDIGLQVDATRGSGSYTAITVTMTCSRNGGTSYGNVNTVEPAGSGSVSTYTATWTKTTSSTTNELFDFDGSKCDYVALVVGLTSGGAADVMDAYVKVCAI